MISTKDIQVQLIAEYWDRRSEPAQWRKPNGWPKKGSKQSDGELGNIHPNHKKNCLTRSLHHALTRSAPTPTFFVGYRPTIIGFRLRTDAVSNTCIDMTEDAGGVWMQLALLDVDAPDHGTGGNVEAWWEQEKAKVSKLLADMPGLIVYRSLRGYRILGVLENPIHIKDYQDAFDWRDTYTAWVGYLNRVYGIVADTLADWTRFQAIPHTTKIKGQPALNLEILGDVETVGYWRPLLIESDYPKKVIRSTEHKEWSGECQLLQLVRNSGLACEETNTPGVYDIHCPNHLGHSETEHRSTKTLLYTNGRIGRIECKSSRCAAGHPDKSKDYYKYFSAEDVLATSPWLWSNHPEIEAILEKRVRQQSEATVESFFAWDGVDHSYHELQMAIRAAATTQKERKSRTTQDYAKFAEWMVDQNVFSSPTEAAYQAYLTSISA